MTGTGEARISAIISRIEVTRPPGVLSCRMSTSALRSAAALSASFSWLALAGPMAPSIEMLRATLSAAIPAEEKGKRTAAAAKAAARRATRASLTLKAPWIQYGVVPGEVQ